MSTIIGFLERGWVNILTSTLIAIVLGYVFYRLQLRNPRVAYQLQSWPLIDEGPKAIRSDLDVRFKGIRIPRLTRTTTVIWNAGGTTFRAADNVSGDPLRISFGADTEVLEVEVLARSRDVVNANVDWSDKHPGEVLVTFAYLDQGDGIRITALHSGSIAAASVKGTLVGLPKGWLGYLKVCPISAHCRCRQENSG
jgi:hypothetical protein